VGYKLPNFLRGLNTFLAELSFGAISAELFTDVGVAKKDLL
jgi:hypothetical protein